MSTSVKLLALAVLVKMAQKFTRTMYVPLMVQSNNQFQLQKLYKGVQEDSPYRNFERPESFIVKAREKGARSSCGGDSGGPFVCNIRGVKKQFGIAGSEPRTFSLQL